MSFVRASLLILSALTRSAWASDLEVVVVKGPTAANPPPAIVWADSDWSWDPDAKPPGPFARLKGKVAFSKGVPISYLRKEGSVDVAPAGEDALAAEVRVRLQGERTPFVVSAVDPRGKVYDTAYEVRFLGDLALLAGPGLKPRGKFGLVPSLGLTYASYSESDLPDSSQLGMTLKVQASYRFANPRWSLAANGFWTAAVLTSSAPGGEGIRYLGFNFRGGYSPPWLPAPWELTLMLGGYFLNGVSTDGTFGFRNMYGPQLYPALKRKLPGGAAVGYVKCSPILRQGVPTFSSWEIAAGGGYERELSGGRRLDILLDVSVLDVEVDGILIDSSTVSLSAGYAAF
jgi:hypothetical protein